MNEIKTVISNDNVTLCDFINHIDTLKKYNDCYEVVKILEKEKFNKHTEGDFLKWETCYHDNEENICPNDCCECMVPDGIDYECRKIELKYYVQQFTDGIEGDSFHGTLVYPLEDHYVFVEYSC
jgi:hypothetical protein